MIVMWLIYITVPTHALLTDFGLLFHDLCVFLPLVVRLLFGAVSFYVSVVLAVKADRSAAAVLCGAVVYGPLVSGLSLIAMVVFSSL